MPIRQSYFELHDIRPLQGASWIPLRQSINETIEPPPTEVVRLEAFTGIATAAIECAKRPAADKLGWSELNLDSHRSGVEVWGYRAVDIFRDNHDPFGINLVIDQYIENTHQYIWYLHPDLVVALRLVAEGDCWFRPDEGWIDVARLKRDANGKPELLEMRTEFLADYLSARDMALFCSSYRERIMVSTRKPVFTWPDDQMNEVERQDRREGLITEASYPESPEHFWTRGCLWRTEWVEPGSSSVRVRGDKDNHTSSFALGNDGTRLNADRLSGAMAWLYFNATLPSTLLRHRGGRLHWLSAETGKLGATEFGVHFGVNRIGLVTVFAKDIGNLLPWEQRLWSAHNVTPEGGVSAELFAAQMEVNPAETSAPEAELEAAIRDVGEAFSARYGRPLLREHDSVPDLLRRTHRFRVADNDGLAGLAKDVTRLFIERVDVDAIKNALALGKSEKLGSVKMVEKLVATRISESDAKEMMAPLFGLYDLRLADAHLGSIDIESGILRVGVDKEAAAAIQGWKLLRVFVDTLRAIAAILPQ